MNFPEEVNRIVSILKERFGKPKDILKQVITNIKPIRDENLENITELLNCLQNNAVILKSIHCLENLLSP